MALLSAIFAGLISCSNSNSPTSIRFELTSGSMAPNVWGPSRSCSCDRCGQSWRIVAETYSPSIPVKCAACQSLCIPGPITAGDQVEAQSFRTNGSIYRLQRVVFRSTDSSMGGKWNCKRVWGLPNEEIHFESGELMVHGKLYQKSLDEFLAVAIPVCSLPEDRFSFWRFHPHEVVSESKQDNSRTLSPSNQENALRRHRSTIPLTWQSGDRIVWCYSLDNRSDVRDPSASTNNPTANDHSPIENCQSIMDDYLADHSTPRRLSAVDDLVTFIQLDPSQVSIDAILELQVNYKRQQHDLELELAKRPQRITLAAFDQQVQLRVEYSDGNGELLRLKSGPTIESPITTMQLVVKQGKVAARSLRVLRDLYLQQNERDPANFDSPTVRVGADEYFVIGDNLPISIDSRNGLGLVPRQAIQAILPDRPENAFQSSDAHK